MKIIIKIERPDEFERLPRPRITEADLIYEDTGNGTVRVYKSREVVSGFMPVTEFAPVLAKVLEPAATPLDVYSAFVLFDDQTWSQPNFSVPAGTSEDTIIRAVQADYGGFFVTGLMIDDDAPPECVKPLRLLDGK